MAKKSKRSRSLKIYWNDVREIARVRKVPIARARGLWTAALKRNDLERRETNRTELIRLTKKIVRLLVKKRKKPQLRPQGDILRASEGPFVYFTFREVSPFATLRVRRAPVIATYTAEVMFRIFDRQTNEEISKQEDFLEWNASNMDIERWWGTYYEQGREWLKAIHEGAESPDGAFELVTLSWRSSAP